MKEKKVSTLSRFIERPTRGENQGAEFIVSIS